MNYWLMKSEPDAFSIDDLVARPGKREHWDGVRNYQARNFMREMKKGDEILFYHSSCPEPGVVGVAKVVKEAYPDFTDLDPESKYYDPKSSEEKPRWFMVDIQYKKKLKRTVTLKELKQNPQLEGMQLLRKGNRLSVMPVAASEFDAILAMV
ncbi:putative RNA-binding protein with PUA-like domain [Litorivivens lipolytica]|uniref:Putative RNA-binding protein with PUA-like domain n=1 Tax=Litorivivens lipolytica TaxID=1524264 RepID=A0A7W4W6N9_9GAMM|nr:EVE domain-containing protein [Litorivivens lipolytica]MBB3048441.1 putative RNA-binding protein with PUA-like domain [Litorivivens lipolytica]